MLSLLAFAQRACAFTAHRQRPHICLAASLLSHRAANARMRCVSTSTSSSVQRIGVVGAGQMGTGIALVSAVHADVDIVLVDANSDQVQVSKSFQGKWFAKELSKGRLTEERVTQLGEKITMATDLSALSNVDFVIEAVPESLDLKRSIFQTLADTVPAHAVLASNTSSISITKLQHANVVGDRGAHVIGMHFMNPVPVMKLVEVISGLKTSDQTLEITLDLAHRMNKVTSKSQDVPGFIANRVLMPYINEAIIALETGVASRDDIDITMKLGTGVPMGPLTLADFIGLDTCLAIMRVLHTELGDSKYRPSTLLQKYVDAGYLGKKSGRGFYDYSA